MEAEFSAFWSDWWRVWLQESEFLKFTFLVFPCLATTWKTSQRKLNSGQHRKHNFNKGKCFPFDKNWKTLSFSFITHIFLKFSNHGLSLFVNNWEVATSASFLLNNWKLLNHGLSQIISSICLPLLFPLCLFSSPLCFYLLRSVRIIA
jgi:hypothetical protein